MRKIATLLNLICLSYMIWHGISIYNRVQARLPLFIFFCMTVMILNLLAFYCAKPRLVVQYNRMHKKLAPLGIAAIILNLMYLLVMFIILIIGLVSIKIHIDVNTLVMLLIIILTVILSLIVHLRMPVPTNELQGHEISENGKLVDETCLEADRLWRAKVEAQLSAMMAEIELLKKESSHSSQG